MPSLSLPFLSLAVLFPILGALLVSAFAGSRCRLVAQGSATLSLLAGIGAGMEIWRTNAPRMADPWLNGSGSPLLMADPLGIFAILLFCALALLVFTASPRRDTGAESLRDHLLILAGALLVYSADHLGLLLAGWVLTTVPMMFGSSRPAGRIPLTGIALGLSCVSVALGLFLMARSTLSTTGSFTLSTLQLGRTTAPFDHLWTLAFLMLAVLLRKGVFPFHSWVASSAEGGDLLKTVSFTNTHLGAFLIARLAIPLLPLASAEALRGLTDLALLTALVASLMAVVETSPRRLIALLAVSQSSFILTGIGSGTLEGITGAMVYWVVVGLATTTIFLVLRMIEVRTPEPLTLGSHHGLGTKAPRLAVFFLVSALALVGLPGTLGFCAEDLLLHGTMDAHPVIGLLLPIATAINAVSFLRMFSRLFLGKRALHVAPIADALPRERLALATIALLLVLFGFMPGSLVRALGQISAQTGASEAFQQKTSPALPARIAALPAALLAARTTAR